ncbi:hypothetical protein ON010_g7335 [Phytophthora cinnamomi]|nr:hypothetical protein ON010_g7335 [Phytophthora cinnamomi]
MTATMAYLSERLAKWCRELDHDDIVLLDVPGGKIHAVAVDADVAESRSYITSHHTDPRIRVDALGLQKLGCHRVTLLSLADPQFGGRCTCRGGVLLKPDFNTAMTNLLKLFQVFEPSAYFAQHSRHQVFVLAVVGTGGLVALAHLIDTGVSEADGLKLLEKFAFVDLSSSVVISDDSLEYMIVKPRDPSRPPKIAISTAGVVQNLADSRSRSHNTNDIADRGLPVSVPKARNMILAANRRVAADCSNPSSSSHLRKACRRKVAHLRGRHLALAVRDSGSRRFTCRTGAGTTGNWATPCPATSPRSRGISAS